MTESSREHAPKLDAFEYKFLLESKSHELLGEFSHSTVMGMSLLTHTLLYYG